jgi:hypothetical protein
MRARTIVVEVLTFFLCLSFFYEGVYKIANWHAYAAWLHHAPLLSYVWIPLTYVIPIGEIVLAIRLIMPSYRNQSLKLAIGASLLFILWIACRVFSNVFIFSPFHALWPHPTWMQKALIAVLNCWMAFSALALIKNKTSADSYITAGSERYRPK